MNSNTMITRNIIRFIISLSVTVLFSQGDESLYWQVADPIVNSKFIEAYINQLIESNKFEDNTIQASHSIIIHMVLSADGVELKKLKAKNSQMGEYQSFLMDQVKKMDPSLTNLLMSREYKWKEMSRRDLSELEMFSTLDNTLQERSFKDARDAFWWTNAQFDVSTAVTAFVRHKASSLAFRLESGFPDLGLYRHLSKNLILGLSNDIASVYFIMPGVTTRNIAVGIGHPLEGAYGLGFKFDTQTLGGQVNYMDIGTDFEVENTFSRKHLVIPASSGLFYWSNTFGLERKVLTDYGTSIKGQKKAKKNAVQELSKSRIWKTKKGTIYHGRLKNIKNGKAYIVMDKDGSAHREAKKGRKWKSISGNVINASLVQRSKAGEGEGIKKEEVVLRRKKDKKRVKIKISDLSKSDQKFLKKLVWDGKKVGSLLIKSLSEEDQKIINTANASIRDKPGKGRRKIKIGEPYASLRIKSGFSFTQFVHGRVDPAENDDEIDVYSITDRINGSEAIGFYVKLEAITDNKKSKSYLQFNSSGSGFKSIGFGLKHNIWKSVHLGLDCALYPKGSSIDFRPLKTDADKTWTWYPGGEGGILLIAPYLSVQF